jgi:hypothetical protein
MEGVYLHIKEITLYLGEGGFHIDYIQYQLRRMWRLSNLMQGK